MRGFTIPSIFTAVDKLTGPMLKMSRGLERFHDTAKRNQERFKGFKQTAEYTANIAKKAAIVGAAILTPLVMAGREAVKFEDKMADVSKTTGLQGPALKKFGDDILVMSTKTRTSIDDLATIAEIGGQLGVAQNELLSFTDAANKFNVALGKDFSGGVEEAVSQIGKVKSLFKDSRGLDISTVLQKTGSAINELGAVGAGTSANITDFTLRVGALPDALKPSLTNTLALGTYLEELGINSEIGSGGLTRFLLDAGNKIGGFARQMGMTSEQARQLLAQDPTEFTKKFAQSFKGMAPEQLSKTLTKLGIGSQESIKVIGALASNTERLTELQRLSGEQFAKGTSLTNEYDKKNETTAAKLERLQNNLKMMAITVGEQLLPVVNDLVKSIVPIIQGFAQWIKENPNFVNGIVDIMKVALPVIGLLWAFSKVMGVVNLVMAANPVGLIVLGIMTLITLLVIGIANWEKWGAALLALMGPIGWIVNGIMTLRKNWDMIKNAFTEGGIIAGIKAIGLTLLEMILIPLEQMLKLVGKIPGMGWAERAAASSEKWRAEMRADVTYLKSPEAPEGGYKPINPRQKQAENIFEMTKTNNAQVDININDPNGRASAKSQQDFVHINTTSTTGNFNNFSMSGG